MENTYFYLSDFTPKYDAAKDLFYFSLGKVQKFLTDGDYGVWEMSKQKLLQMKKNFENYIQGYDVIAYEASDHLKMPRENLAMLKEIFFDENKNELIGGVKPLNEETKKILSSGKYQRVSPEFSENYQNKRNGEKVGATLTGILFTDKTYQPDLTPSYALSDNVKTKIQFLKNLEPKEVQKMDDNLKLLSELQNEKIKLFSDNEKLLSEKESLRKQLSDSETEIKMLSEKNEKITSEIKTLSDKLSGIESAAYTEKVEKLLSDNSKGENVKILAAEIEPLKKLLSDPKNFESAKAMIDARQSFKLSDMTTGAAGGKVGMKGTKEDPAIISKMKSDNIDFVKAYKIVYPNGIE